MCTTNGCAVELNNRGGTRAVIFWNITFPCGGILREFQLYAYEPGTIYFDIWRKTGGNYRLEYIVPINITVSGIQASIYFATTVNVYILYSYCSFYCS